MHVPPHLTWRHAHCGSVFGILGTRAADTLYSRCVDAVSSANGHVEAANAMTQVPAPPSPPSSPRPAPLRHCPPRAAAGMGFDLLMGPSHHVIWKYRPLVCTDGFPYASPNAGTWCALFYAMVFLPDLGKPGCEWAIVACLALASIPRWPWMRLGLSLHLTPSWRHERDHLVLMLDNLLLHSVALAVLDSRWIRAPAPSTGSSASSRAHPARRWSPSWPDRQLGRRWPPYGVKSRGRATCWPWSSSRSRSAPQLTVSSCSSRRPDLAPFAPSPPPPPFSLSGVWHLTRASHIDSPSTPKRPVSKASNQGALPATAFTPLSSHNPAGARPSRPQPRCVRRDRAGRLAPILRRCLRLVGAGRAARVASSASRGNTRGKHEEGDHPP
ncbi:hypothetical protein EMIHUDRAFT_436180 [Emiliania huxleyi CCMP1516]|uniref:Sphingomyelin synthase-like domain-containing protein n=2 Tax=Emiliania huxleyi TaxID=2903 RepID=A0A0D3J5R5_EMIH1|nr:hypothetical protein EMIHUDRAFT_436180 [Emiliania huxleyi CCMP1516]EOD18850.1 hypothetical protein EMIHUDRAFT_436180 [Emiliania huxleyi CCMP1516]|eukprot:XP_005771279.1 hypothetical protein EMIHUDRAFT_436180 [Emiliania huxleyi CCMP1516]